MSVKLPLNLDTLCPSLSTPESSSNTKSQSNIRSIMYCRHGNYDLFTWTKNQGKNHSERLGHGLTTQASEHFSRQSNDSWLSSVQSSERVPLNQTGSLCVVLILAWVGVSILATHFVATPSWFNLEKCVRLCCGTILVTLINRHQMSFAYAIWSHKVWMANSHSSKELDAKIKMLSRGQNSASPAWAIICSLLWFHLYETSIASG